MRQALLDARPCGRPTSLELPPTSAATAAVAPRARSRQLKRRDATTRACAAPPQATAAASALALSLSLSSLWSSPPCLPPALASLLGGQGSEQCQAKQATAGITPKPAPPPKAAGTPPPPPAPPSTPEQRAAAKQLIRDIMAEDNRARTQEFIDAAMGTE